MNSHPVDTLRCESLALVNAIDDDPLVGSIIRGDASREEYVRFLVATYHYVRWSGPILAASAAGIARSGRHPWLVAAVSRKADEEAPHDRWVLRDLQACGENVELVKAAAAPIAVRAYVHWSLSMAEAGSPAFLGAAYALEFMSMSRARLAARNLRSRAAIAGIDRAVTFLAGHGDADEGHVEQLEEALARLEDAEDQSAILLSASLLRRLYPRFFRGDLPLSGCWDDRSTP